MQNFLDRIYDVFAGFLPEKIMRPLKHFFTTAFLTFLVIGVVNTLSTTVISTLLDAVYACVPALSGMEFIENLQLTFILGYIFSMLISFFLNCRFTFHEKPTAAKLVRFPVSYIPNFILQYIVVHVFVSVLRIHPTAAYLVAAVLGIPVTFLTMKLFVFRKK